MKALFTLLALLFSLVLPAQEYQDDCEAIEDIVDNTVIDLWPDLLDPATSIWCGATFQSPSDSLYLVGIVVLHTDSLAASEGLGGAVLNWVFIQNIGTADVGMNVDDLMPGTQYFASMRVIASESLLDYGMGNFVCDHTSPVFSVWTLGISTNVSVLGETGFASIQSSKSQTAEVYSLSGQLVDRFWVNQGVSTRNVSALRGFNIIRFEDGTAHKIFVGQ